MKRVILGLSGGVDSSVAALLLKQQGYTVEALFMKNWTEDDNDIHCPAAEDFLQAQQVCEQLDIPLHQANFSKEYWEQVFEYCLEEFDKGRTPNPDILCNREIKFKVFLDHAIALGADCIATGHYAQIAQNEDAYRLQKAQDPKKDQTYFLYAVEQSALAKTLFPIGHLNKSKVREIAREAKLPTADKKDSTGICFIGERKFKQFLSQYLPLKPGPIKNTHGDTIAEHDGLCFYTLGQRNGLGIGGLRNYDTTPWYVVAKDIPNNTLVVAQGQNHPLLLCDRLHAKELHWINGKPTTTNFDCYAKTRYGQTAVPCHVTLDDTTDAKVVFTSQQRAITPGQSVVFYQQDVCLGGGIIQ